MDAVDALVLDGSVTMVWGFEDEADKYAISILDRMPDLQAHVPSLWPLEVANALCSLKSRSHPKEEACLFGNSHKSEVARR